MTWKMSGLVLAGVCALAACGANNVLWTNATGNNRWSDVGNWLDGVKPLAGDTVYTSNTVAGATMWIDEPGVSVRSIRFEGSESLALIGEKLTLTGGFTFKSQVPAVTNGKDYPASDVALLGYPSGAVISNDVTFTAMSTGICLSRGPVTFHGTVSAPDATTFILHNGLTGDNNGFANCTSAHIQFRGAVDMPKAYLQAHQYPCSRTEFFGPVVLKKIGTQDWTNMIFIFGTDDVTLEDGGVDLLYTAMFQAIVPDALPANAAFAPSFASSKVTGEYQIAYNLGNQPQTIDHLGGDLRHIQSATTKACSVYSSSVVNGGEKLPTVLTLKGSADAVTPLRVCDQVSVVWDPQGDFTQTFTGRVHTTTGALAVKRGTVALVGETTFANAATIEVAGGAALRDESTSAGSLANARTVALGAGATLSFATTAATPFSGGKAELRVCAGATVSVPAGLAVSVRCAYLDGVPLPAGTYTAATCAWVAGGGSVSVAETFAGTAWKNAAGGSWNDAANWTAGVPAAGLPAWIGLCGDYAVALDAAFANQPDDVTVENRDGTATLSVAAPVAMTSGKKLVLGAGARLVAPAGGAFVYDGASAATASATEVAALTDGASIEVNGGSVAFTNMTGRLNLGVTGMAGAPNRIRVTDGSFTFFRTRASAAGGILSARDGSVLEATGGEVVFGSSVSGQWCIDASNGGYKFDQTYSGTATMRLVNASTGAMFVNTMGPGTIRFTGDARYAWSKAEGAGNFRETLLASATHPATLVFEGNARALNVLGNDALYLKGSDQQPATFIWGSAQKGETGSGVTLYNNAHLLVTNGTLKTSSYGVTVGSDDGNVSDVTVSGNGCLELNTAFRKQGVDGLVLGYGCGTATGTRRGMALLCDNGVISNTWRSAILVGAGHGATGEFRQTGGRLYSKNREGAANQYPVIVGFAGGTGTWTMSAGTAYIANDVWVGGCPTNRFDMLFSDWSNQPVMRCPHYDGLGATGTLTLDGGAMQIDNTLFVGAGDHGTVAVNGGELAVRDLVLSNNVSSVVSFTAKNGGIGVLKVAEKLTVATGSKLVVDARDFTPAKSLTPVLTCGEMDGAFAAADIEFLKPPKSRLALLARPDGYALYDARGTVLVLR